MGIGNKTIRRRSPFLLHMQGVALTFRLCGLYTGCRHSTGRARRYGNGQSAPLYYWCHRLQPLMLMRARSRRWSG